MRFHPKSLRSPDPKIEVVRVTDFTDRGMARFRVVEDDHEGQEVETLLEFYGPSDGEVEEFLLAWHRGDPYRLTSGRYTWYVQARERASENEQKWRSLGPSPDREELDHALADYRESTCFARLLLNAFSGIWLDLSEARTLA